MPDQPGRGLTRDGLPPAARALQSLGSPCMVRTLPHVPLLPVVIHNGVAHVSGQLPRIDGRITCLGVLGETVSLEDGVEAAGVCALNALAGSGARARRPRPDPAVPARDRLCRKRRELQAAAYGDRRSEPHFSQRLRRGGSARTIRHRVAGLPHGAAVEVELSVAIAP